ncbi:RICIN domain-containing protein [Marinoscillum furvescens]|uniref:Putative secreted protein (Por secretion system target) n=1 Tax=Marinoscillum furvescens DSM 4134 TaxID=1122208 RepID=A0A3D9L975_MARFU|nr:RICIN domain-containing protein [Marinoscillum furvescens]REE02224.1 putative secreted protein (Por secretion system target) [Marinoscillum furvescens DSM 4134]
MISLRGILYSLLALLIAVGSEAQSVKVNPDIRYQTIDGWGTSLSWWANIVGAWPDSVVQAVSNELTSSDELNMNIFRYNIHGGDDPAVHSGTTANHFRWDSGEITSYKPSSTSPYDWTANSAQRKVLQEILQLNSSAVLEAIAYSPPYWMTVSGCSAGGVSGAENLSAAMVDDFADFLTDVVEYYHDSLGITFSTVSGLNEPSSTHWKFGGRQEGCVVSQARQRELIVELYNQLQSKGMLSYCGVSAADEYSMDYTVTTLQNYRHTDNLFDKLAQINTHSYAGDKRSAVAEEAHSRGLKLWQSESGPLGVTATGIENHLVMAQRIILDINRMHTSAWVDWQAASTDYRWGLYTLDTVTQTLVREKSYFVRKQMSKYIKPGYQIVHTGNDDVLAALNNTGTELVVVAVNNTSASTSLSLDLSDFASVGSSAQTIRTSSTEDAVTLSNTSVSSSVLSYSAPAHSITTFVMDVTVSTPPAQLADGLYMIKAKHSGKYFSVTGATSTSGSVIEQWSYVNQDNLKFTVKKVGLDYVIKPKYNELTLAIDGAGTGNGALLKQLNEEGKDHQRFVIIPVGSGYYKMVNKNSGKYLAVSGESTANGADVVQWSDLDTDNFYWSFEAVSPSTPVVDGTYMIKAEHSGKYMSVAGWSTTNGALIEQWGYLDQDNLKFEVTAGLDGYYQFRPIYNQKVITVSGGATTNGAAVDQYTNLQASNQKFLLESAGTGLYRITPKHATSKSLAVSGSSMSNGADVVQWEYLGLSNYKWSFEAVSGSRLGDDEQLVDQVSVYPNPTSEWLYLQSPVLLSEVRLLSITGQQLHHVVGVSDLKLPIGELKSGVYLLEIRNGDQVDTRKIIVKD